MATSLQMKKQPVAPPVYRPQAGAKIVQPRIAQAAKPQTKQPVAPPVYRPQPQPKVLQTRVNLNAPPPSITINRSNAKLPAHHAQPVPPKVLQGKGVGNRQVAIKPAGHKPQISMKVANPAQAAQASTFSPSIRRQPQHVSRVAQMHPAKTFAPKAVAGQSVQPFKSRVIQRKGKYFIEGKEVKAQTPLTDGRVWSEDKQGDFHAVWPLAPYVGPHEKRNVPTVNLYKELGLSRQFGLEPARCVGSKQIVIGIPYRDDAFGASLKKDAMLVRFGTGCSVRILYRAPMVWDDEIDALYIPGAPFDLPGTKLLTDEQAPKSLSQKQEWEKRLAIQEAWVKWADEHNKPVLGICGGSRRLAQFSGGSTEHLTPQAQRMHRGNYQEPNVIKHEIIIKGDSQLGKLILTGNYRALPEDVQRGLKQMVESGAIKYDKGNLILNVNSMHWAQSTFPESAHHINLSAHAPDKTLEGWERRDRPFWMGVQWHPEYAQTGVGDFSRSFQPHANIMRGLGQAATEDAAIRILQTAIRAALARQEMQRRLEEQRRREAESLRVEDEQQLKSWVFTRSMELVANNLNSYKQKGGYTLF